MRGTVKRQQLLKPIFIHHKLYVTHEWSFTRYTLGENAPKPIGFCRRFCSRQASDTLLCRLHLTKPAVFRKVFGILSRLCADAFHFSPHGFARRHSLHFALFDYSSGFSCLKFGVFNISLAKWIIHPIETLFVIQRARSTRSKILHFEAQRQEVSTLAVINPLYFHGSARSECFGLF